MELPTKDSKNCTASRVREKDTDTLFTCTVGIQAARLEC